MYWEGVSVAGAPSSIPRGMACWGLESHSRSLLLLKCSAVCLLRGEDGWGEVFQS